MRPTLWLEVKRIFAAALDVAPAERVAFVRAACPDAQTCDEVLRLVRRHEKLTQFLNAPTAARVAPAPALSESVGPDGKRYTRSDTAESPAPEGPPLLAAGAVIVGRYELGERLGAGAFGAVHRAKDRLTGQDVAVKVLHVTGDADRKAMRREIAILRMARLPGLVELLDDGIEHGHAFLVMRLVDGKDFPGDVTGASAGGAVRWADLAPRAIALVEALGRLHWLGVLHRDLKPDNVLVDAAGGVTIVDLGVARDLEGFGEIAPGYLVGAPGYLAPERLGGAPATVASDLYAIGMMLYELIAGRSPRDGKRFAEIMRTRSEPVPALSTVAPDVPGHVADTVDALLRVDPSQRPRSSRLVAALLRGEGEQGARIRLPFVGSDAAVVAVVDAVKAKRPLDLAGPVGCGRTRTLEEADKRLTAEGYRVLWCRPGTKPFESLVPVVGEMPDDPELTLEDIRKWLRRCLHFWLDVHVCVVADDWAGIDARSREVLEAVRGSGPLVRVFQGAPGTATAAGSVPADAVVPAPRTEIELRELFHGPDRLVHLREDGGAELFRRTEGRPGDFVREIEGWIDGGAARFEENLVVIDRAGLEKLDAFLCAMLPRAQIDAARLPLSALDALGCLEIAGCPVPDACVAEVLGRPTWETEATLLELERLGAVVRRTPGTVVAIASCEPAVHSSATWRARAHRIIAEHLPRESSSRLHHLAFGDAASTLLPESLAVARRLQDEGRPERAMVVLAEALAASRRAGVHEPTMSSDALVALLRAALACGTLQALDLAKAEFERSPSRATDAVTGAGICAAARGALNGDWARSLRSTEELIVSVRQGLAVELHQTRALAARWSGDLSVLRSVTAEVARWARASRAPERRWLIPSCIGWLRYREGRFRRAAELHQRAAARRRDVRGRLASLLSAASAALEAPDMSLAVVCAASALSIAESRRFPTHEARATWILRSAKYRAGEPIEPDAELVAAAGSGNLAASECARLILNEAAIAFRSGHHRRAAEWAIAADAKFLTHGRRGESALARALARAAGADVPDGLSEAPTTAGSACPVQIQAQVAALDRLRAGRRSSFRGGSMASASRPGTTDAGSAMRREILSDVEVNELLASGPTRAHTQ